MKWLPECEISDDVKGRVVEPADQVDCLTATIALLVQTTYEKVNVVLYDILLLPQCLCREAARQVVANPTMVLLVCGNYAVQDFLGKESRVPSIFACWSRSPSHHILPCIRVIVGQLVRGNSDDWAVLAVQREKAMMGVSGKIHAAVGDSRNGPKLRSRVLSQRMKVQIVSACINGVANSLIASIE
jgi:hypothetical protein